MNTPKLDKDYEEKRIREFYKLWEEDDSLEILSEDDIAKLLDIIDMLRGLPATYEDWSDDEHR